VSVIEWSAFLLAEESGEGGSGAVARRLRTLANIETVLARFGVRQH
jgi:hypothetical protein